MKTLLHRLFTAAILIVLGASSAHACLWDTDTLAAEAKGLPDVVDAAIGWFDRNPPRYYEMRLERVTAEIKQSPAKVELYDDAAVACERLGRSDDAIAWMDRKLEQLNKQDPDGTRLKDARYRYLANRGTFYIHRWFGHGADREKMDDIREGLALIHDAIKLNPDAHFGREKYQAKFAEWVMSRPKVEVPTTQKDPNVSSRQAQVEEDAEVRFHFGREDFLHLQTSDNGLGTWRHSNHESTNVLGALKAAGYENAAEGITGLIVLGSAWESVDCYQTLAILMGIRGHNSLSLLATLRARELARLGKKSVIEGAPAGERLAAAVYSGDGVEESHAAIVRNYFETARRAADERTKMRTQFMEARFAEGRHPDTDANFWDGYREPLKPALPSNPFIGRETAMLIAGVLFVLLVSAIPWLIWRLVVRLTRSAKKSASAPK